MSQLDDAAEAISDFVDSLIKAEVSNIDLITVAATPVILSYVLSMGKPN